MKKVMVFAVFGCGLFNLILGSTPAFAQSATAQAPVSSTATPDRDDHGQHLQQSFKRMDSNQDGMLSEQEFTDGHKDGHKRKHRHDHQCDQKGHDRHDGQKPDNNGPTTQGD